MDANRAANSPAAKAVESFRQYRLKSPGLLCHRKILCQFGSQLLRLVLREKDSGMTFIHQDEISFAPHPIDMLERTVEENGWAFERSGRDELNLSVAGKWSDHHFSFTWRDDLKSLHLSSTFDMRITEGVHRQNIADLLMYVNARLWIGHFDLWHEDGTIVFRHAMIFPGAEASPSQCEALLNLALEACEHYYPAFQFVLWGGKSAKDAVDAAVLECAGRA